MIACGFNVGIIYLSHRKMQRKRMKTLTFNKKPHRYIRFCWIGRLLCRVIWPEKS